MSGFHPSDPDIRRVLATDPQDPNIGDLIGHAGGSDRVDPVGEESADLSSEQLIQNILNKLPEEQRREAQQELTRSVPDRGPGILVIAGAEDSYRLTGHFGHLATLVPKDHLDDPYCDSMEEYAGVILVDNGSLPDAADLLNRAKGKPVALLSPEGKDLSHAGLWCMNLPLDSEHNREVVQRLAAGDHPPAVNFVDSDNTKSRLRSDEWPSPRERLDPEELDVLTQPYEPSVHAGVTSTPEVTETGMKVDPLSLIRLLLEARSTGESSAETIKKWVEGESALQGWVEVTPGIGETPQVRAGGRSPGDVYRELGSVMDQRTPIPAAAGEWGAFIGFRVENHWMGILPGKSPESRRAFWDILDLIPGIENLIPIHEADGTPRVEDPESRFERLLHSRIRSSERRGLLPGVLLLEFPGSAKKELSRLQRVIRATDWCEVSDNRIWVLVDQPDFGAAQRLSSRILEALPGVRGGGTIGACTGYVARQCMDRVIELLRNSDQETLNIEEEISRDR